MFKTRRVLTLLSLLVVASLSIIATGCKKDDGPADKTEYTLMVKDVLGVTGTATFIETSSSTTTIEIKLNGAPAGSHPAALCMNSAVEGGNVVISLNPVVDNGTSSTKVTSITYAQLIAYDGFIKVTKSTGEPGVILAQGDIGGNVITSTNKTYNLLAIGSYGVSGTALFEKRINGSTLVSITLIGAIAGQTYPASINLGSISTPDGGPIVNILSIVDGTTGKSYSNVRQLISGSSMTYEGWLDYAGHINIYQNAMIFENIICQGNIGSN